MQPQNIIIRMPNWIGDLVMATPVLTDVRKAYPHASITAMCQAPLSELLQEDVSIDELFCFKNLSNGFLRREDKRNVIEKVASGKYDLGILLTNSFSSAWWFWQGRVTRRVGFSMHWRRLLLTDAIQMPAQKMHQVDLYKKILQPLGIAHSKTAPRLYVTDKEVQFSKTLLYQRGYIQGKPLVGINPGAAYGTAKCWPPERFRELAMRLLNEGFYVVFFGNAGSESLIKNICQALPQQAMNLVGVTNLRELSCLIKDCDLLVTNDSGPMHIAAAFGTPIVALFGSTDDCVTGPYGQEEAVVTKRTSCSPCFKRVCPIDFRCMMQISVDEIFTACKKRMRNV